MHPKQQFGKKSLEIVKCAHSGSQYRGQWGPIVLGMQADRSYIAIFSFGIKRFQRFFILITSKVHHELLDQKKIKKFYINSKFENFFLTSIMISV